MADPLLLYGGSSLPLNPALYGKTLLIAEAQSQVSPGDPWVSDGISKTLLLRGTAPFLLTSILVVGERWRLRKLGPMPINPMLDDGSSTTYGPLITSTWSSFFVGGELWILPGPHADGRTLGAYGPP